MAKKEKAEKKDKNSAAPKGKVSRGIANPVRNLIVTTAVSILLGLAFFLKPIEVSNYCGYGVGGLLAVVGIVYILIYFLRKPVDGVFRSEFVIGLVALLAGAYVALSGLLASSTSSNMNMGGMGMMNSSSSSGGVGYIIIVRVIGVLIVADGLLKIQYAVDIGRMGFRAWWIALIIAVVCIGIGVLTATDFTRYSISSMNYPKSYFYSLGNTLGLGRGYGNYASFYGGMKMLGIAFIGNGILDLVTLLFIAIRISKAAREEAIAEASAMIAETKREEVALPEEQPASAEPAPVDGYGFHAQPAPDLMPDSMPETPAYVPGDPSLEEPPLAMPTQE